MVGVAQGVVPLDSPSLPEKPKAFSSECFQDLGYDC